MYGSKIIDEVGYSYCSSTLAVGFVNGRGVLYGRVPHHVYLKLLYASSVGTVYNESVKGYYFSMPWYRETSKLRDWG